VRPSAKQARSLCEMGNYCRSSISGPQWPGASLREWSRRKVRFPGSRDDRRTRHAEEALQRRDGVFGSLAAMRIIALR
jgi:hypothetical protein